MLGETVDGVQVAVDGGAFLVGERDLLEEPQDVVLGVDKLCERGFPGAIEVAPCAGHSVRALVEELVGAQAMAEVVVAPGLSVGDRLLQGVLVDQHFDRAQVACEVSGVGIGLGELGRGDGHVVLSRGRRTVPPEVATRLIALKLANPTWSVRTVIRDARDAGIDYPLAPSTVHRLFHREGLFDSRPHDGADRRRFAFRDAGELWMSDVMYGPKVRHGRTRRKSYLIAFIDDATRVVPFAAFATAQNVRKRCEWSTFLSMS